MWGIQALASRQTTVWPTLTDTVSGSNRLTATSWSPQLAVTVAPVADGAWAGAARPLASVLASPSALSAAAATTAEDWRSPSVAATLIVPCMKGCRRQNTV